MADLANQVAQMNTHSPSAVGDVVNTAVRLLALFIANRDDDYKKAAKDIGRLNLSAPQGNQFSVVSDKLKLGQLTRASFALSNAGIDFKTVGDKFIAVQESELAAARDALERTGIKLPKLAEPAREAVERAKREIASVLAEQGREAEPAASASSARAAAAVGGHMNPSDPDFGRVDAREHQTQKDQGGKEEKSQSEPERERAEEQREAPAQEPVGVPDGVDENSIPSIRGLVTAVMGGRYGNGDERREKLGQLYDPVQHEVNMQILGRDPVERSYTIADIEGASRGASHEAPSEQTHEGVSLGGAETRAASAEQPRVWEPGADFDPSELMAGDSCPDGGPQMDVTCAKWVPVPLQIARAHEAGEAIRALGRNEQTVDRDIPAREA